MKTLKSCIVLFVLVASGCRHNPNFTPAQNAQINLYSSLNAITAANKAVAQGIVSANAQGSVNDSITREVLNWSEKVNEASGMGLTVLDSSQSPEQKALAVINVLKTLDLPKPVSDFVNSNPGVAATLSIVKSIVSIQQLVTQINATPPAQLSVAKTGVNP